MHRNIQPSEPEQRCSSLPSNSGAIDAGAKTPPEQEPISYNIFDGPIKEQKITKALTGVTCLRYKLGVS